VTLGATGSGSNNAKRPVMLNDVIGTKFKMIFGYTDTASAMLAMERGEIEGTSTGWGGLRSSKQNWLRDKALNFLVQYGNERHPDLPDVPTAAELGKTAQDRQLLELFGSSATVGKAVLAPPGMPEERLAVLRSAFDAMVADPEFRADIERSKMEYDPMSGARLQSIVHATLDVPDALRERAQKLDQAGN
jgi:tripartite-type tricarboxylate transporter receptor subunit TctC